MHQNISLGSNGVDRVPSLRKNPTRLRGTNFCTRSAHFAPSFIMLPIGPKLYEMYQNISLWSNGVDRVRLFRKIPMRLRGTNFCTSSASLAPIFVRQSNGPKCTPNSTKRTKTLVYGPMGWIGCIHCEKFDATSLHKLLH